MKQFFDGEFQKMQIKVKLHRFLLCEKRYGSFRFSPFRYSLITKPTIAKPAPFIYLPLFKTSLNE
ncbi:MAG: hypothetical protein CL530_02455 [Aequorivita sp.]|nr:hypothetical protein [Aequorivita sp.]